MKKSKKLRIERRFWLANIPAVLVLVVFFPKTWETVGIPYVAFLSVYALVITAQGAEQAAIAVEQGES